MCYLNEGGKILVNPTHYDVAYRCIQRLFKDSIRKWHLSTMHELYTALEQKATQRYFKCYPPRKNKDPSIGDALNWEWIIHCANESECNIIIVSDDQDYGKIHGKNLILNDWLEHEFKERVNQQRKIKLTNKLSDAFELLGIHISDKVKEQEEETISTISEEGNPILHKYIEFRKSDIENFIKNITFSSKNKYGLLNSDLFNDIVKFKKD
jgi:hypothetical protein